MINYYLSDIKLVNSLSRFSEIIDRNTSAKKVSEMSFKLAFIL